MVIGDSLGPPSPGKGGQMAAFFDLYFALTSESGLWTFDQMSSWQRDAGLVPRKPIRLPFARAIGLQAADRPWDNQALFGPPDQTSRTLPSVTDVAVGYYPWS